MTQFIWPSDQDRASNDELNRVCECLDEALTDKNQLIKAIEILQQDVKRKMAERDAALEELGKVENRIRKAKAQAIREAVIDTQDSMTVGGAKWLCRVEDLNRYADKIEGSSLGDSWRPIEEANKDGQAILLYSEELVCLDFNPEGVVEGAWMFNPHDDAGDDYCWVAAVWNGCHDNWVTKKVEPTHFMMKPTPPKGSGK